MEDTKEQERITLPISLALTVWEQLKSKHNIEQRMTKNGFVDMSFSHEELGLITKLNFQNPVRGCLQGVSQLYNLKTLIINTDKSSDYSKSNNTFTISNKDMQEVCKCSSLTDLSINNQADIDYISLNRLQNLECLSIKNNRSLEQLDGINSLKKLEELSCYGNRTLFKVEGLNECIKQNPALNQLNLDLLLFPDSINFDHKTGSYDKKASDKIQSISDEVTWHEAMPRLATHNCKKRFNSYKSCFHAEVSQ
jgi:hypothetical protein